LNDDADGEIAEDEVAFCIVIIELTMKKRKKDKKRITSHHISMSSLVL